jgi:hypothetical protein
MAGSICLIRIKARCRTARSMRRGRFPACRSRFDRCRSGTCRFPMPAVTTAVIFLSRGCRKTASSARSRRPWSRLLPSRRPTTATAPTRSRGRRTGSRRHRPVGHPGPHPGPGAAAHHHGRRQRHHPAEPARFDHARRGLEGAAQGPSARFRLRLTARRAAAAITRWRRAAGNAPRARPRSSPPPSGRRDCRAGRTALPACHSARPRTAPAPACRTC